jgi:hypothetical protein
VSPADAEQEEVKVVEDVQVVDLLLPSPTAVEEIPITLSYQQSPITTTIAPPQYDPASAYYTNTEHEENNKKGFLSLWGCLC